MATDDEQPSALLVAEILDVDRRAQQLARDVAANPALRATRARDAAALEIHLSVVEGALAILDPREVEGLRHTIGETLLDLRFVREDCEFNSLRLARFIKRHRLEVSEWTRELDDITARAASMTEETSYSGKASDSIRQEGSTRLQRLDELATTLRVLSPAEYERRDESVSIARHELKALIRGADERGSTRPPVP